MKGKKKPAAERYPLLYQINTRVMMTGLGRGLGRTATLDDIPDAFLDDMRAKGFDWLWFLGLWQTGEAARKVSLTNPILRAEYVRELPDFREDDVCGSPFAIKGYKTHADFGGDQALARLRARMADRGLLLLGDYVANHVAPDHPWVDSHPEYFIAGTEEDIKREPQNWARIPGKKGKPDRIFAFGRDPYFPGWPDTLQLNYRHAGLREAMGDELLAVAKRCDGVRCDMAMLVQPDIFQRTWGDLALPKDGTEPAQGPFWRGALGKTKAKYPGFLPIAEVYWDREWELQQEGFEYTYDKRLYDRLVSGSGRAVREHLLADPVFQDRSLRFLENHDEPRAADTFPDATHRAAAVLCFLVPGMRFFHDGEFQGRRVHVSMHLRRRPDEPDRREWGDFYARILSCLRRSEAHEGAWHLEGLRPAWDGNATWNQFVAFSWRAQNGATLFGIVNYGPVRGQCYAAFGLNGHVTRGEPGHGMTVRFKDLMGDAVYDRDAVELERKGMYFDLPPWGYHVFEAQAIEVQEPVLDAAHA
jgi:hypothetical protein